MAKIDMNESRPITYLLVEDDETQACILKKWLMKAASPLLINVLIENNLEDGVRVSNTARPDTTFLDLHVPLRKGEPICDDWRMVADASRQMIPPVIGVTGYDITPEMRIYCITDRGMHHLYRKPYNEGFFAKLRDDTKLFAAELIRASGDAVLRSAGNGKQDGA